MLFPARQSSAPDVSSRRASNHLPAVMGAIPLGPGGHQLPYHPMVPQMIHPALALSYLVHEYTCPSSRRRVAWTGAEAPRVFLLSRSIAKSLVVLLRIILLLAESLLSSSNGPDASSDAVLLRWSRISACWPSQLLRKSWEPGSSDTCSEFHLPYYGSLHRGNIVYNKPVTDRRADQQTFF